MVHNNPNPFLYIRATGVLDRHTFKMGTYMYKLFDETNVTLPVCLRSIGLKSNCETTHIWLLLLA